MKVWIDWENREVLSEQLYKVMFELEKKRFVNYELLKNGLSITDKKLGIIIEAVTPQGSIYNRKGKSNDLKDLSISTINEEA